MQMLYFRDMQIRFPSLYWLFIFGDVRIQIDLRNSNSGILQNEFTDFKV